jgi:hypothetical protein
MRWALLTIGALLFAGCTASAEQSASRQAEAARNLAKAIGDRQAGKPTDCINSNSNDGPQIIDRKTVIYRQGQRVWVNTLEAECPGLEPFNTMIVELHGSQICRNDQFRILEPGSHIPGAYCRFGKFTPYSKPKN